MIRLLIADDEKLEREALAELVQRRFEREVVLEMAENGRKAADTAVLRRMKKKRSRLPYWILRCRA